MVNSRLGSPPMSPNSSVLFGLTHSISRGDAGKRDGQILARRISAAVCYQRNENGMNTHFQGLAYSLGI
jgi:hypothetical protein